MNREQQSILKFYSKMQTFGIGKFNAEFYIHYANYEKQIGIEQP